MSIITTAISLRDPYVLVYEQTYYLYGTRVETCWGPANGFDVYISNNLTDWDGPFEVFHNSGDFWADRNYWAPEVYRYRNSFYMFASFKNETRSRGTQILYSASPLGPFVPISDGPVTPADWECLDGTFFLDDNHTPYLVFCHEWSQIQNGTICAVELLPDLTGTNGNPFVLFDAKSAGWTTEILGKNCYVTDGPFLYRMKNNSLVLLWASHGACGYAEATARSSNGTLHGVWKQCDKLLFIGGGHGMIFEGFDKTIYLALHAPDTTPLERVVFLPVRENSVSLELCN